MNLAKLSSNGQITLPAEIRTELGLKTGDKVLFFKNPRGEIVLNNASAAALQNAQSAFAGAAMEADIKDEDDVQRLVDDVRYGRPDK